LLVQPFIPVHREAPVRERAMDDLDRLALAAARETVHVDFIATPTEAELNTLHAAKQVLAMFGEPDASDFRTHK
jgi:hypothetical protein